MSKHPLIDELGLPVNRINLNGTSYVRADDLEKILEQAPVVYGEMAHGCPTSFSTTRTPFGMEQATHTALLLNVKPIVRESEERQLLRELITRQSNSLMSDPTVWNIAERAKALLAKGEK